MANARSEIYDPEEVGVYHCVSRCVRRAFLCGKDSLSKKSFEHRRRWIKERLTFLTEVFAIEVISYAVMSNHLHCLIKNRPDVADIWSKEEIAIRWRKLFPYRRNLDGEPEEPTKDEILEITADKVLVELYRKRLSNISWFNRCMNENIARRANFEDKCKGRFWEGRFKCQKVFDLNGLLACSVYVDLNPIRAGIAKTPEASDFTSIKQRIAKVVSGRKDKSKKVPLVKIEEISEGQLTTKEYLMLVDETGRLIVENKGNIPEKLTPILERLKISPDNWIRTTTDFRFHFKRMVGCAERLRDAAQEAKKSWFQGVRAARVVFS